MSDHTAYIAFWAMVFGFAMGAIITYRMMSAKPREVSHVDPEPRP